jgi:hypothetical protein
MKITEIPHRRFSVLDVCKQKYVGQSCFVYDGAFWLRRTILFTYKFSDDQNSIEVMFSADIDAETQEELKKVFLDYEKAYPDFSIYLTVIKQY